jgi:hypothetical protein
VTTTQTRYMPTYEAEASQVTAGEVEPGDLLLTVLRSQGRPEASINGVVTRVVEGPSFHRTSFDRPLVLGRVRITVGGPIRGLLLLVGQPVIIQRRISTPCQHATTVDNEQDNGWTERCLDCGARGI